MKFVKLHRMFDFDVDISNEIFVPIDRILTIYPLPIYDKRSGAFVGAQTEISLDSQLQRRCRVKETPEEVVALIQEKTK